MTALPGFLVTPRNPDFWCLLVDAAPVEQFDMHREEGVPGREGTTTWNACFLPPFSPADSTPPVGRQAGIASLQAAGQQQHRPEEPRKGQHYHSQIVTEQKYCARVMQLCLCERV